MERGGEGRREWREGGRGGEVVGEARERGNRVKDEE